MFVDPRSHVFGYFEALGQEESWATERLCVVLCLPAPVSLAFSHPKPRYQTCEVRCHTKTVTELLQIFQSSQLRIRHWGAEAGGICILLVWTPEPQNLQAKSNGFLCHLIMKWFVVQWPWDIWLHCTFVIIWFDISFFLVISSLTYGLFINVLINIKYLEICSQALFIHWRNLALHSIKTYLTFL